MPELTPTHGPTHAGVDPEALKRLNRRIRRLERLKYIVTATAGALGITWGVLFSQLRAASQETAEVNKQVKATRDSLDDVTRAVNEIRSLVGDAPTEFQRMSKTSVRDAKVEIDAYVREQRQVVLGSLSANLLGKPEKRSLDQWYSAPTHGFVRLTTGGTGDVQGVAWVNAVQDIATPNRATIGAYTSVLLLVRRGEYFRAHKAAGSQKGSTNLFWIPFAAK